MKKTNRILLSGLALALLTGCSTTTKNNMGYATLITMDVNPSIQLELDDNDKVIKALGMNAEAQSVLEGMDLTSAKAKVAVNAVLGSLVKEGFLNVDNNTVLLSVENDDKEKRQSLEKELSDEIHVALQNYKIDGAILAQDLNVDDGIQTLTDKYDISYGKAGLIEEILKKNSEQKAYKEEDLVKLNAQELILIYQQASDDQSTNMTGSVSQSGYLTKDEAVDIVLKDASLKKTDIQNLRVEYDTENGVLTYEIEFDYGNKEYDYEVNVEKGIIEKDVDFDDDRKVTSNQTTQKTESNKTSNKTNTTSSNKTNTTNKTTTTSSKKYTKDEAISLALKDAGLKKSEVTNLRVELDDGVVYEIEFRHSNTEYNYDVHNKKGIIDKEVETKKSTTTTNTTYTKDQAIALALKDAGLKQSQVSNLRVEFDDGKVYEVDFRYDGKSYSYDVHINKGITSKEVDG